MLEFIKKGALLGCLMAISIILTVICTILLMALSAEMIEVNTKNILLLKKMLAWGFLSITATIITGIIRGKKSGAL